MSHVKKKYSKKIFFRGARENVATGPAVAHDGPDSRCWNLPPQLKFVAVLHCKMCIFKVDFLLHRVYSLVDAIHFHRRLVLSISIASFWRYKFNAFVEYHA